MPYKMYNGRFMRKMVRQRMLPAKNCLEACAEQAAEGRCRERDERGRGRRERGGQAGGGGWGKVKQLGVGAKVVKCGRWGWWGWGNWGKSLHHHVFTGMPCLCRACCRQPMCAVL